MDDQTVALIISKLDDLREDGQRNFDLLVSGQKTLYEKFEAHAKDDQTQFEAIRTDIAATGATSEFKSKLWAAVGSVCSLIVGAVLGIVGDWLLFGRGH